MKSHDSHWSVAQIAAFDQIGLIIREHFEAGVVVLMAEVNDHQDETNHSYHGGKQTAIGLLSTAKHRMLNQEPDELE